MVLKILKRYIPGVNRYDEPMVFEHKEGKYVKYEDMIGLLMEIRELLELASTIDDYTEPRLKKAVYLLEREIDR